MRRRTLLGMLAATPVALVLGCRRGWGPEQGVTGGLRWLASQQGAEGAWSGPDQTARVVEALDHLGAGLAPEGVAMQERALTWLAAALAAGPLGDDTGDDTLSTTAIALHTVVHHRGPEGLDRAVSWLLERCPGASDPALDPVVARRVLEAVQVLIQHGTGLDAERTARLLEAQVTGRARFEQAQARDGGFALVGAAPVPEGAAPVADGEATADGILALLACGAGGADPAVASAVEWLRAHHSPDRVPGAAGAERLWAYRAAAAQALSRTGGSGDWSAALLPQVGAAQQPDGSWVGAATPGLLDDPLVVTALALSTVAWALRVG